MADSPKKIYWDSCAWIGLINSEPDKIHPLRSIWEAAQRGKYEIWSSAYVYLEVVKGHAEHGDPYPPEESDKVVEDLLRQPYVVIAQLDSPIAKLARNLKRSHHQNGLSKRPDAIHLATALYWNVEELQTWDRKDLLHLDGRLTTRSGRILRIRVPGIEDSDTPLFASLSGDSTESKADEEIKKK